MSSRAAAQKTRDRLLEAGGAVFAEKGFRGATIAEICKKAEANIAAVNYHFGDKETLYVEAWRYSFNKHMPVTVDISDEEPESQLRILVKGILDTIRHKDISHFAMFMKERANPTGLLDDTAHALMNTITARIQHAVQGYMPSLTSAQAEMCAGSIKGQCFHYIHKSMMHRMHKKGKLPSARTIQQYIEHIINFSLAGIRSYQ